MCFLLLSFILLLLSWYFIKGNWVNTFFCRGLFEDELFFLEWAFRVSQSPHKKGVASATLGIKYRTENTPTWLSTALPFYLITYTAFSLALSPSKYIHIYILLHFLCPTSFRLLFFFRALCKRNGINESCISCFLFTSKDAGAILPALSNVPAVRISHWKSRGNSVSNMPKFGAKYRRWVNVPRSRATKAQPKGTRRIERGSKVGAKNIWKEALERDLKIK